MQEFDSLLEITASGDFSEARKGFSELLEKHPESREFEAGLYTAAYWDNRSGFLNRANELDGNTIVTEWETFEKLIEQKGYAGYKPIIAAMYVVLGKAADSFRKSFQNKGLGNAEFDSLLELGRCLLRIEDYSNARDILQYARKLKPSSALALFLMGEGCLLDGDPLLIEKGLGHYRDGFLIQPAQFPFDQIRSNQATSFLSNLQKEYGNENDTLLMWLPCEFMTHSMVSGCRRLNADELNQLLQETARLENDLRTGNSRYEMKIKSRLTFYYLVSIQAFTVHQSIPDQASVAREKLKEISPAYYKKLQANIKENQ